MTRIVMGADPKKTDELKITIRNKIVESIVLDVRKEHIPSLIEHAFNWRLSEGRDAAGGTAAYLLKHVWKETSQSEGDGFSEILSEIFAEFLMSELEYANVNVMPDDDAVLNAQIEAVSAHAESLADYVKSSLVDDPVGEEMGSLYSLISEALSDLYVKFGDN